MSKTKAPGGRPPKHNKAMGDPIGIRLPPDLVAKIDEAAAERGWTRNEEVRRRLSDSFPLSDSAAAMANVLGLYVEQIEQFTGKPLHTNPFSWVALQSALRCLMSHEPSEVVIPESLLSEAQSLFGEDTDQKAQEFADYIGLRVQMGVQRMLENVSNPIFTQNLSPERRALLESIQQDFRLNKLWANNPKSGFIPPKKAAKGGKAKKKEPSQ